jgi:hypothetical protein
MNIIGCHMLYTNQLIIIVYLQGYNNQLINDNCQG